MGALSGSASFMRFSVEGDPPEAFWDFVADKVAAHSFKDIDDSLDEYSIGWVSVANMFDADFEYASYGAGDYVVLTLRVDERKVSASVLKKCVLKEEERVKRERQVPRLSRSARLEIKERVRTQLARKSVPVPSVYDLIWKLADGILYFFTTNKKAMVQLEEFFKETFGLSLVLQVPWNIALHVAPPESEANLDNMRPEILV